MSSVVLRGCRVLFASAKTGSTVAPAAKTKPKTKPKQKAKREGKSSGGGLAKPVRVSQPLASFLGVPQSSRTDAVKGIWAHIKLHNLQNPANKREINCDSKLKMLFSGRDKVTFVEITKFLSPHFVKTA